MRQGHGELKMSEWQEKMELKAKVHTREALLYGGRGWRSEVTLHRGFRGQTASGHGGEPGRRPL